MFARIVLASAILGVCARPGAAQIVTDRPDFVESSITVPAGGVQVETSLAYERTGPAVSRSATYATPTLVRVGVSPRVELRLESELFVRDASAPGSGAAEGLADAALGLKWHVVDERGATPSTALLFHADLPTGSAGLRGHGVRPSVRAAFEWAPGAGLGLGAMPGLVLSRQPGATRIEALLGVVVGKEIVPAVRVFAELAVEGVDAGGEGRTAAIWNTGASFLLSDRLQLDVAASLPATDAAPDLRWTVGVSRLFTWDR